MRFFLLLACLAYATADAVCPCCQDDQTIVFTPAACPYYGYTEPNENGECDPAEKVVSCSIYIGSLGARCASACPLGLNDRSASCVRCRNNYPTELATCEACGRNSTICNNRCFDTFLDCAGSCYNACIGNPFQASQDRQEFCYDICYLFPARCYTSFGNCGTNCQSTYNSCLPPPVST